MKYLLALFILSFLGCMTEPSEVAEPIPASGFTDQQLGQLLVVGFRGTEITKDHPIIKDLRELHLGGVILYNHDYMLNDFKRNIESPDQVLKLASALISNSPIPPIIAVEQDGSFQSALTDLYDKKLELLSAGFLSDSASVVEYSRKYAQEFLVLGINTNFNPRLDLKQPTNKAPTPGLLAFKADEVTRKARFILDEYDKEGLFSVPKYFPGYPTDYHPRDSVADVSHFWNEDYLIPYKQLLTDREIGGIMTAHSFNSNIDSLWPGTLSAKTINGLLRDSLHFDGVVFSDDLQKPILSKHYDLETTITQALNAGVDVLLFGNNFEYDEGLTRNIIDTIQQLIEDGKISKETIQTALDRVDRLKQEVIAELCTCLNL